MKRISRASLGNMRRAITTVAAPRAAVLLTRPAMQKMVAFPSSISMVQMRGFAALPAHVKMAMPALSPTMATGNLAKWKKQEGDALNPGDVIAEVETDKATVDFECQDTGFLAKILIPDGSSEVPVGKLVALFVDNKEAADIIKAMSIDAVMAAINGGAVAAATPAAPPAATPSAAATPIASSSSATPSASAGGRIIASPYAKKLASDAGISLSAVGAGTGPGGRIVAADIKEYKPAAAAAVTVTATAPATTTNTTTTAAPAAPASTTTTADARSGFKDIPHSNMRRVIAQRLTASKQSVPHYYLTSDVQLDAVLALRATLNADLPADSKLSVNDFLIKASALACKKVPEVNSSWLDGVVRAYDYVDVSVAVSIPDGLVTPIIRDANTKGLVAISSGVKTLVEKARAKKLAPEDYQGGTFTISNLGMFGIRQFAAIINPPQAAILAVGGADRRVVPDTTPGAASPFKQAVFMSATLSCDHRVVDGAVGAQWLSAFKGYLENPNTMLL